MTAKEAASVPFGTIIYIPTGQAADRVYYHNAVEGTLYHLISDGPDHTGYLGKPRVIHTLTLRDFFLTEREAYLSELSYHQSQIPAITSRLNALNQTSDDNYPDSGHH